MSNRLLTRTKFKLHNFWNFVTGNTINERVQNVETELAAANKKIIEQATELKRLNEELEHLGYVISHDLKSPIRNISSFMHLLLSRFGNSFEGEAKEFMAHSKISAERLSRQIDDLLAYCRTGRNLPLPSPVDLNQMIETISTEMKLKIVERNVQLTTPKAFPILPGLHSGMIHHIFQNLIENSIKFNTNEKIEVKIDFTEEKDSFTFSVSDNGIGIDPVYKSKLFQMFRRLHNADQFQGTGVGLAVCKKIVTFYNGDIWFESEPGNGATFYFSLPKKERNGEIWLAANAPSIVPASIAA